MCLLLVARNCSRKFPFVLAFNRDEYFSRPTQVAKWWEDAPSVFGGRDRERGGSWLGVTRDGFMAALSFVRQGPARVSPRSRGKLVANYLLSPVTPGDYFRKLQEDGEGLLGFNLVLGHLEGELVHYSNVTNRLSVISDGIWGISNADLNSPWPKIERGKQMLSTILNETSFDPESLFRLMGDSLQAEIKELPNTGISAEQEKALSSIFISLPEQAYGTRSTTLVLLDRERRVNFVERTYAVSGAAAGEAIETWPLPDLMTRRD